MNLEQLSRSIFEKGQNSGWKEDSEEPSSNLADPSLKRARIVETLWLCKLPIAAERRACPIKSTSTWFMVGFTLTLVREYSPGKNSRTRVAVYEERAQSPQHPKRKEKRSKAKKGKNKTRQETKSKIRKEEQRQKKRRSATS